MKIEVLIHQVVHGMGQMRTAVVLLGLCALASMAGTLVVQGLPIQDYVAEYGVFWARVLWYSGLTDVFRAWWFVGILFFLLSSVSVCVVRNGPQIGRQMRLPARVPAGKPALAVDETQLRAAGFRRMGEVDGTVLWQRGTLNRVGYFLVHIGVLGVAVAGLISGFVGWRGTLNLREGEQDKVVLVWKGMEATPVFLPFSVRNDGFEIEQYPSGMPSRYATQLRFDGGPKQVVEVNHPLRHGAYAFYQASFGDGGSEIKGKGINLADGRLVPFEGHVYEKAKLGDGTRIEILDFRPFTVETFKGVRPTDVGPSVDYLVQPPDDVALQLRAFLNHPGILGIADGQQVGGQNDGAVIYRPVRLGAPEGSGIAAEVWWRMLARVSAGEDFKQVAGPELATIADETLRIETGLQLMQAAKAARELRLSYVLLLEDFTLKRYSGLQVAHDPGATPFWLASCLLVLGVMLMLGRKFSRVWVKDGRAFVTSPHGARTAKDVVEELAERA